MLGTPEKKMNNLEPRIYSSLIKFWKKELNHLEKIRIRIMLCLSFINLN
jgi:hypothetical protein